MKTYDVMNLNTGELVTIQAKSAKYAVMAAYCTAYPGEVRPRLWQGVVSVTCGHFATQRDVD